jgi:hypothetical protein
MLRTLLDTRFILFLLKLGLDTVERMKSDHILMASLHSSPA